ncbi:hypothetical protein GCM10023339_20240 [Alloalcanivorax gelatiniphagus]
MERWRVFGRRRASRPSGAPTRSAPGREPTPVELRVYLPLLWPDGPDAPVDQGALRALGRDYARAGRAMDDLLTDLDILCSVVGIGASSSMVEASSVAWSDAFLDAVAAGPAPGTPTGSASAEEQADAIDEVARRLAAFRGGVWGDLAPTGHLLLLTWSSAPAPRTLLDELDTVAREVRRAFPGAVVVEQPRHRRLVAAVADDGTTARAIGALRARCAELVTSTGVTVTAVDARAHADVERHLFRSAG